MNLARQADLPIPRRARKIQQRTITTVMKIHPILFSGPLVQAIIQGRKTQTRRIVKGFALDSVSHLTNGSDDTPGVSADLGQTIHAGHFKVWSSEYPEDGHVAIKSPALPGDLLYVRETWRKYPRVDESGYTDFDNEVVEYAADNPEMIYQIDADGFQMFNKDGSEKFIPWRPSIHMPRSAARIWLQVESVRVERLQDISEEDAYSEGCDRKMGHSFNMACGESAEEVPHRRIFRSLWQSVYGPESWEANQWVWVISFKVLSTTGMPDIAKEGAGS